MLPTVEFIAASNHPLANSAHLTPDRTFSTVSLNIAKTTDPNEVVNAIRVTPRLRDADLYLFQEVRNEEGRPSVAEEAARKLGHSIAFAASAPGVYDQGLAMVSRLPITNVQITPLKAYDLRFHCRNRIAMAATVQSPRGDLYAWNVHLDTRINPQERIEQLQPVIDDAASHTGPRLIGGDFNTNGMYWLGKVIPFPCGRTHSFAIRSAMKLHGFESPLPDGLNTFPPFRRHLDWIFLNELQVFETSVVPAPFSDHNAILVRVGL